MSKENGSVGVVTTSIKPSGIADVLDMALEIRKMGGNIVPLFGGHAGIGKTQQARDWSKAKGKNFQFVDVRLAYLDRPDMIGLPTPVMVKINGQEIMTTVYALPEFLPKDGEGIIVWEEPNRAPESNMNTLMQILAEREIGKYKLPEGFIQCGLINPEGMTYSVNTMDTALKNRFTVYNVVYDFNEHLGFMKAHNTHKRVIAFVEGGGWQFKAPEELKEDATFVSPRTFQKLSEIEHYHDKVGGTEAKLFRENVIAVLGADIGPSYYKFAQELKPVMFSDFQKDPVAAFERVKKFSQKGESYKGDMVAITVNSLVDAFTEKLAQPELIFQVCEVIDMDQAIGLLQSCTTSLSMTPNEDGSMDAKAFLRLAKKFSQIMLDLLKRRLAGELTQEEQSLQATGTEGKSESSATADEADQTESAPDEA